MSVTSNQAAAASAGTTNRTARRAGVKKMTGWVATVLVALGIMYFSLGGIGGVGGGTMTAEERYGTPDWKVRFLFITWYEHKNPAVNAAGEANYWVLFEPNARGVNASFVHKAAPEMAPCLLPTNVYSASAGATSITVCAVGPKGLPYFDGTPQLRALAETIRSCSNCSWLTGRLKPGGMEPAPEVVTLDASMPNWRQFNTGPEDVGHGNCFIIRPFTLNVDDEVRMRYRDLGGAWHDYSPDEIIPGREFIAATAFQMLNHSPLPVAYEISSRKPLNIIGGGNQQGLPFVCLRAS